MELPKPIDDNRVVPGARSSGDVLHCFECRHLARPVHPRGRYGVKRVGNREDSRTKWDLLATTTLRISGPIPSLVMTSYESRDASKCGACGDLMGAAVR